MEKREESSLLKSLAIAFGDGLAFGVGMKIVQVSRKPGTAVAPAPVERIQAAASPAALASPDHQVLERISAALDARLSEQMSHVERRIADTEARIALELRGVDNRASARIAEIEAAMGAQDRGELEARLRAYVDERIQALEERLHGEISEAGTRTAGLLVEMIEKKVLERLGEIERAAVAQSGAIQALRESSGQAEHRFQELVAGFARLCQETVQPQPQAPPASPEPAPCRFDSLGQNGKPERNWRVPLVSLSIAAAGLAALISKF